MKYNNGVLEIISIVPENLYKLTKEDYKYLTDEDSRAKKEDSNWEWIIINK